MSTQFSEQVKDIIKNIPRGKVSTYGQVARLAGNPRAARQVVRILHACSEKENLPWQRVINKQGKISLKPGQGYELQKRLLEDEGIEFGLKDCVNLDRFLWP